MTSFSTSRSRALIVVATALFLFACGEPRPATTPSPSPSTHSSPSSSSSPAPLSPALDEKAVASAVGLEAVEKNAAEGVVKASFPRKDVDVVVDGWKMQPFQGLTSWAAFSPGRAGVAEAMVMGDLVLFEDEVNPVMSVLLDNGLSVTALHNHFFYDSPRVYFMHIGGEGAVAGLGRGVRLAMDSVAQIRKSNPKPVTSFGGAASPPSPSSSSSTIDGAKIDALLHTKGQSKDGMYKATIGRSTTASCGCAVKKSMGVNTWAAFGGSDDSAVVDGDFAVTESELQSVLKTLRAGGINIVAIHHHMTGESPRILFLHYWGRGKSTDLATTLRKALDQTAMDKDA